MKITIDVPSDMEQEITKKCDESHISPSEFVYALLDWYFYKKKEKVDKSEIKEFLTTAKKYGVERVRYCKYSDRNHCALEVFDDLFAEKEPEVISPYKCLFCSHFVDKRKEERRAEFKEPSEAKMYELAKIAARFVVELYGDKLGYRPENIIERDEEEDEEESKLKKGFSKKEVRKLMENW
ncbi:MAG: hypothetical protein ACLFVI_06835 [Archaeoglobaceae archaeon]